MMVIVCGPYSQPPSVWKSPRKGHESTTLDVNFTSEASHHKKMKSEKERKK